MSSTLMSSRLSSDISLSMSSRKSVLLFPNRSRFSDAPASSDVGSVASSTGAPDKRGAAGSGSGVSSTGGPERGGTAGSGSEKTGGAGGSVGREGGSGSAAIIGSEIGRVRVNSKILKRNRIVP